MIARPPRRTLRCSQLHHLARSGKALGLLLALAIGCSPSPGQPAPQPLPAPDAFPPRLAGAPRSPRIAGYRIDARLDPQARTITARQRLHWTNRTERAVNMLPFHLYMNAFKNEQSVFMRESRGVHRKARHREWGFIDVHEVSVDGTPLRLHYPGPDGDETVMEARLPAPLAPGEAVDVDIRFEVKLPQVFARTGYAGDFFMIGQWFPKVGVLAGAPGAETWHCPPFHLNSEFFADFGNYHVSLTVPDTHVVAATGVLIRAAANADGTRTLTYRAEDVHDFAWMADPYMKMMKASATTELGEVEVRVYYRPPQEAFARRHLHAGVGAIEAFSRMLVPYPWPIMSIVDPPPEAVHGAGGMEYPTLVTTSGDLLLTFPGIRAPESVTVHEVGHNWFQGILASNESEEAWLDEGVNRYVESLVMEELFGAGAGLVDWYGLRSAPLPLFHALGPPVSSLPMPIASAPPAFPDSPTYGGATYLKTALALGTLESIVGADALREALRTYARRFQFAHPTGTDLFATLTSSLDQDLSWFLHPAFHEVGAVAYEVRTVECRKQHAPRGVFGHGPERRTVSAREAPDTGAWACEVLIVNVGRVPAPVDVHIAFADGTTTRQRWQAAGEQRWQRYHLEHTAPVTEVIIDPDGRVLLNDNTRKSAWRRDAAVAPTRRATARLQHWTQTLMQLIGAP